MDLSTALLLQYYDSRNQREPTPRATEREIDLTVIKKHPVDRHSVAQQALLDLEE